MTQRNAFDMTLAIPLPIPQTAIALADRFAQRQPNPRKASQVRLNTLAVYVVQNYLQLMGIDTSLSGDSWNPVTQLMADVADLEIAGLGRLECRPVSADAAICSIPPETWHDRIGYVVVQIDEPQQEAQLLGFVETVEDEELLLSQLQPPEALLDCLDRLMHPVTEVQPAIASRSAETTRLGRQRETIASPTAGNQLTSLSQWLQNRFQEGWETVESLLSPQNLAYGFRSSASAQESPAQESPVQEPNLIRRAKRIHIPLQATEQPLILVVELMPQPQEINIRVQLHYEFSTYLPAGVQLAILDNTNAVFLQAESRQSDNYIQLAFGATPGEAFAVQVQYEGAIVSEAFVV